MSFLRAGHGQPLKIRGWLMSLRRLSVRGQRDVWEPYQHGQHLQTALYLRQHQLWPAAFHFFFSFFFGGWRRRAISFLPHQIFTVTVVFARQGLLPILNLWSHNKAGGSVGLKSALKQQGYDLCLPCLGLNQILTSKVHLLGVLLPPGRAASITRLLLIAWRWQLTQEEHQRCILLTSETETKPLRQTDTCVWGGVQAFISVMHM